MARLTRRSFLTGLAAVAAGTAGLAGYAFRIEPGWRLNTQRYRLTPPGWPAGLSLRLCVIADIHGGEPLMSAARIEAIVDVANRLAPDAHLLLGDYAASHRWLTRLMPPEEWAAPLSRLEAPLGVHAVLGNHDWWDDWTAQTRRRGPVAGRLALERAGIPVYENDVVRLTKNGQAFWLAGLGDQLAYFAGGSVERAGPSGERLKRSRGRSFLGVDDLPGTLAKVTDDAPVILMAHEPDIFPEVPARVSLTISGHTHGGQVRVLGYSPMVPSRFGNRYAYGHIVEDGRHLLVSGGLGCSILPVRFGVPPELVLLEIGGGRA